MPNCWRVIPALLPKRRPIQQVRAYQNAAASIQATTNTPACDRKASVDNSNQTSKSLHANQCDLKQRLLAHIDSRAKTVDRLRAAHDNHIIGHLDIATIYGGMRDMPGLICETSLVDPQVGLLLRGRTIDQCRKELPAFSPTTNSRKHNVPGEPMAEGVFWLLCTGEIPSAQQANELKAELRMRAHIPDVLHRPLMALPLTMHPMTQLAIALMLMGSESEVARLTNDPQLTHCDVADDDALWDAYYEDCLNLIARLPLLCAFIYHRTYGLDPRSKFSITGLDFQMGKLHAELEAELDWCGNFIRLLGFGHDENFAEFFRLSLLCHCDHENGSVYAHTNHVLSSALCDPYRAYAGAINGLAGPLHGLANQHALLFYKSLLIQLQVHHEKAGIPKPTNNNYDDLLIENCIRAYMAQPGRTVPGYGHAVLRHQDPRYLAMQQFIADRKLGSDDQLVKFERQVAQIVPRILMEKGRVKMPWPNIDANSGVMLHHFGIPQHSFYTVFFALAGSLGPMASTLWSRGLRLPMEEPDSLSTEAAMQLTEYVISDYK